VRSNATLTTTSLTRRWQLAPLGSRSIAIWANWTLVALAGVLLLVTYIRSIGLGGLDYSAYFDAGNWVRSGHGLYERALAWRDMGYAPEYPMQRPPGMAFLYPPAFAIAMVPATFLSLETGFAIWLGTLFAALFAATWVAVGTLFPQSRLQLLKVVLVAAAAAAFFQPVRTALITGQVDILILLLLALALRSFVQRKDGRTALLLAVAITIKPTIGFLVLFLLWKRAYRAAVVCSVVAGVLLLAPFALTGGLSAVWDYIAVSAYASSAGFDVSPINQSPFGMLLRLFTANAYTVPFLVAPVIPTIGRIIISVGTLAALARLVRRSRSFAVTDQALEYSLVIIGLLVAGPLSEAGHYSYLLVPVAAIAAAILHTPSRARTRLAFAGCLVLLYGYLSLPSLTPMDCVFFEFWQAPVAGTKVLLTGMHVYGLLAMTLLASVTLWWSRGKIGHNRPYPDRYDSRVQTEKYAS
jgi:alpha-1,2-mannosyltransferase